MTEEKPAPFGGQAKRRSLIFLFTALAGGNLAANVLRLVGGLLQAHYIDKVTLGRFNYINIILNWTLVLQVGTSNGLNRELPYYFGRGDRRRGEELAATARSWLTAMGVLVCFCFLAVAAWHALNGDGKLASGWAAQAILVVSAFYGTLYLQASYRTSHDFARLALVTTIVALVGLPLAVPVRWLGFYGLSLRAAIMGLVGLVLLQRWRPLRMPWQFKLGDFRHLLVIGVPIFFVGELGSRLLTLTGNTLVHHYLSDAGLGLYVVVTIARETADNIPVAMGQIMYPRMTEYYGRTHDLPGTLRMTIRPMLLVVLVMIPLVALGWLLVRPLMLILLKEYIEAVPAIQWSLLLPIVLACTTTHNVYNICRRQDLYMVVVLAEVAAYAFALWFLRRHSVEPESLAQALVVFPQAMLFGRIVLVLVGYLFLIPLYWWWKKNRERLAA